MTHVSKVFAKVQILMAATVLCSQAFAQEPNGAPFDYKDYAAILKTYVDDNGMVNYRKLKQESERLDAFVTAMEKLNPKHFAKWTEKEKIAFWLNAYNSLTLKVIIQYYPIKSSFFRSRIYPKNSIRQIPGVWDKISFKVMGKDLTLGHIEHKILRKNYDEPRIHMAMVCAAMSCPPLRNEPYTAKGLDEQLDDQSRKFLSSPTKFRIDEKKQVVYLSPILKWFKDDFVHKYSSKKGIAKHGKKTSAVLNFIAPHLKEADGTYILKGEFKIKYLSYDWSLNEQPPSDDKKKQKDK